MISSSRIRFSFLVYVRPTIKIKIYLVDWPIKQKPNIFISKAGTICDFCLFWNKFLSQLRTSGGSVSQTAADQAKKEEEEEEEASTEIVVVEEEAGDRAGLEIVAATW